MYNNNNIILIINEGNVKHNELLNSTKAPDIIARLLIDDVYGLNLTGENTKQKNNKTQIDVDLNKIKQLAKKLSNYNLSNFTNNKHTNTTNINKNTILQILQYMLQSIHTIDTNSVSKNKVLNVLTYMLESINADDKSNSNIISKDKVSSILNYMLESINAGSESNTIDKDKVLSVLTYMLESINAGDKSNSDIVDKNKVLSILNYMLESINAGSESNTIDNGVWKLVCFKKNSPSHTHKDRQYDLYRLADEKLMAQLKEKLDIDYFALNYTTRQPTELERYLGNIKPVMQDCNCQIMAFNEQHQPLPQFSGQSGITNVHLQKTNDKNTFNLIPGQFPVIKEPTQTFNNEQFVQAIGNILKNSDDATKELVAKCSIFYNSMLKIVYEDLKQIKNANNYNLADLVVSQFVNSNESMTGTIKNVFNDLMASTATPIITNLNNEAAKMQIDNQQNQQNQNQQNQNQQEQQLLGKFEAQFKQQLNTNQLYTKLKKELQSLK